MIRIALRSDHRLFRDSLAVALDARPDCVVVGNVADLDDLPVLCQLRQPDVVLVDIGAEGAGHRVLSRLRDCVAMSHVVVVYERLSSSELGGLWRLGVDTLLPCTHGFDALLVVLQRYITGAASQSARAATSRDGLTEQEEKIITLLSAGHTVNRIAQLLETSTSAVANAKRRIYRKLEVASQCQAVSRATALGLIHRPAARPASNGRAPGAVIADLRGAVGPVRDQVAAVLLAGGVPVALEVDTSRCQLTEPEALASRLIVLVDPAPADWPSGSDTGLPVVLVRSTPPRRAEVLEALLRGAATVVTVDQVATGLMPALILATHGYVAVDAAAAGALLDAVRTPSGPTTGLPELTARECDILRSIANGHTVRQTGRALGIAEKTVENTQARLFRKLGVRNRSGALAAAHALGLLELVPSARSPV